jgi:hypothetical protein
MQRMCYEKEAPPCTVQVPERCASNQHLAWRTCANAKPPPCMHVVHSVCAGLPTGEKHMLTHNCSGKAPNVCVFCTKELRRREELEKQRDELAKCARPRITHQPWPL